MSNYIDLEPQVSDYYGTPPGQARRAGICDALRYLDSHPERVPGRTITGRQAMELHDTIGPDQFRERAARLGITITPDQEPTNAEKLEQLIDGHINVGGITPKSLAEYLALHDVKAPGGDDE